MKLIVAGGRDYSLTEDDFGRLSSIEGVTEVVSGGAMGADAGGERWAKKHGIPIKLFHADWTAYGRSAGPIRNRQMASYADAVALFPGGRGTNDMAMAAVARGLKIFDWRDA